MSRSRRVERIGERILDVSNALLLAVMVGVIFLQVVARYVFDHALSWPEEAGRFLFVWIVFLAAVSVARDDEMLSLELIHRWIPERWGRLLKLLVSLVCFGFLLVVLKGGYELTVRQSAQISTALEIPMWIVYLVIPVGSFLMALVFLIRAGALLHSLIFTGRKANGGTDPR